MWIDPDDIAITTYYAPMHLRMHHPIMVRATYRPTGHYLDWNQERSVHKNIEAAIKRLTEQLNHHFKDKA